MKKFKVTGLLSRFREKKALQKATELNELRDHEARMEFATRFHANLLRISLDYCEFKGCVQHNPEKLKVNRMLLEQTFFPMQKEEYRESYAGRFSKLIDKAEETKAEAERLRIKFYHIMADHGYMTSSLLKEILEKPLRNISESGEDPIANINLFETGILDACSDEMIIAHRDQIKSLLGENPDKGPTRTLGINIDPLAKRLAKAYTNTFEPHPEVVAMRAETKADLALPALN